MKAVLAFGLAAVLAGVAAADDLLDEVLRWDKPAERPKAEMRQEVPAELPTWEEPAAEPRTEAVREKTPVPAAVTGKAREEQLRRQLDDAERRAAEAEEALREAKRGEGARAVSRFEGLHGETEMGEGDSGMAGTESRVRLGARAGSGGEKAVGVFAGDLLFPLEQNNLELGIRGFLRMIPVRHDGSLDHLERPGVEVLGVWRPMRGKTLSPYAGIGGRMENAGGFAAGDEENTELSVAWRAGLALNFGCFSLAGEASGGTESTEYCAVAGFRLTEHVVLDAFASRFDFRNADDNPEGNPSNDTSMGGGLAWVF